MFVSIVKRLLINPFFSTIGVVKRKRIFMKRKILIVFENYILFVTIIRITIYIIHVWLTESKPFAKS